MQGGLYLSKGTGKVTAIFWDFFEHILLRSVNLLLSCSVTAISLFATSLYANFILLLSIFGHNI